MNDYLREWGGPSEGSTPTINDTFYPGQTVRLRRDVRAGQLGTILAVDEGDFDQSREYKILLLASGQVLNFIDESEIESYEGR